MRELAISSLVAPPVWNFALPRKTGLVAPVLISSYAWASRGPRAAAPPLNIMALFAFDAPASWFLELEAASKSGKSCVSMIPFCLRENVGFPKFSLPPVEVPVALAEEGWEAALDCA